MAGDHVPEHHVLLSAEGWKMLDDQRRAGVRMRTCAMWVLPGSLLVLLIRVYLLSAPLPSTQSSADLLHLQVQGRNQKPLGVHGQLFWR